jgi:hypothetical protein
LPLPRSRFRLPCAALALAAALAAFPARAEVRVDGRIIQDAWGVPHVGNKPPKTRDIPNFREELRLLVDGLAQYAETRDSRFILIGRMPLGLMATSDWERQREALLDPASLDRELIPDDAPGGPFRRVLRDFDAIAFDDVNCPVPPPKPDARRPTLAEERRAAQLITLTAAIHTSGKPVLSLDACSPPISAFDLAKKSRGTKSLSVVAVGTPEAPKRLPTGRPPFENPANVDSLSGVRNAIWLRSPRAYAAKEDWLLAMGKSNADMVIVDAFYAADQPLSKAEVEAIKYKFMGARRLVLAEIDLTAARDDRFYWKREWKVGEPPFLREPQPGIPTGILVNYWDPAWKEILGLHFKGLMDLGFDGVLIDGLSAADRPEHEIILE